ncbi:MAG: type 4a pilus biogenesis protein PilO [Acidobacteriota bacterium]
MDFKGYPLYVQLIIILVVCLALVGLAYWFVYKAQYEHLEQQQQRLDGLNKEIQQGLIMEQQLPEFKKEVKKLEAKLQTLKRILPEQREVAELIQKVKNLADLTNLTIKTVTSEPLRPIEFYAEYPWKFEIEGTYHNLAGFFDKISKFSRIINVTDAEIRAIQQQASRSSQASTIESTFLATTFVFIEEKTDDTAGGAAEARTEGGGGKKGGKKGGKDGGAFE